MRLFYTLLVFGVAFQMSAYLIWGFNVSPQTNYPLGNVNDFESIFNLSPFRIAFTAAGAIGITLAALLLRVGTYAIYAVTIWVIGTLLDVVAPFFLAIPNSLGALIPPEINGVSTGIGYIMVVIGGFFAFAIFWFFVELLVQRNVT